MIEHIAFQAIYILVSLYFYFLFTGWVEEYGDQKALTTPLIFLCIIASMSMLPSMVKCGVLFMDVLTFIFF